MPDFLDDVSPVVTVERHAVDEKGGWPFSDVEISDPSRFDVCEAAAFVKCRDIHETSDGSEANLDSKQPARCRDLAQFADLCGGRQTPQRRRRKAEELSEMRGEVTVAPHTRRR